MKITNLLLPIVFFSLLSSFYTVHAEQCFPQGSITVSLPGSTGQTARAEVSPMGDITIDYTGGALRGHIDSLGYFTASNNYKTVSGNVNTSCNIEKTPIQKANELSESINSEVKTLNSNRDSLNNYNDSATHKDAIKSTSYYKQICPYKLQPESQLSQTAISSAGSLVSEIKKYSDGTYAIFKISSGQYLGPGTENDFTNYSLFDKDNDDINKIALGTHPELTAWNGSTLMKQSITDLDIRRVYIRLKEEEISKYFSDENNCLERKICPLNSILDSQNSCSCIKGYGAGAGKSLGKCVPQKQAWEDSGLFLYGDLNSKKTQYGYECNDGYLPNETKSKCVLIKNIKNQVNGSDRILKKGMSGPDVLELQTKLKKLNYLPTSHTPSKNFRPVTATALIKFQKDNKISPANGIFAPTTQEILLKLAK